MTKLFSCTVGLLLLLSNLAAQKPISLDSSRQSNPNFYNQTRKIKAQLSDGKGEGSLKAQIEKMEIIWADRLFPSGLAASMANGMELIIAPQEVYESLSRNPMLSFQL